MNSSLVVVLVFGLCSTFTSALDLAKVKEAAKKKMIECKGKEGATDADLEALANHKLPSSKEGVCLLACIFESGNIIEANGKFNKANMIDAFSPYLSDQGKSENLKKLADTCEKEVGDGTDRCNNAKVLAMCLHNNAKSHGLDMPTNI